jgi:uncharacterized membrane protein
MPIRIAITILCGVGLHTALFMLAKSRRAERGELTEPSVVESPRARLFGPPNALLGAFYYPAAALGVWFAWALHLPWLVLAIAIVSIGPAVVSLVLAYSLLFVTRRACPYCWTAHATNWLLVPLFFWLYNLSY